MRGNRKKKKKNSADIVCVIRLVEKWFDCQTD